MIYGDEIIQEIEYKLIAKEISILFGNVLLEDVHATYSTKKIYIDINIRTVRDGGRNDKNILHGPAVKVKYNKDLIDIFIKHKNNSNDYYCEIDRKYDKRKADKFISDKSYKIISKFCLKNAKEICKIWDTREGSEEYNKLMDTIKKNNPEFNYQ